MNKKFLSVIDCGSNSFHLNIVEIFDPNKYNIIYRRREVVRIGVANKENEFFLSSEGIKKAINVLSDYLTIISEYNSEIIAFATSAIRESVNTALFLKKVKEKLNLDIKIISANEEAELIYSGVCNNLDLFNFDIIHIEIGGGSTEIIYGKKGIIYQKVCLELGAVRLTNMFFPLSGIMQEKILECDSFIENHIKENLSEWENIEFQLATGSAGTIQAITGIIQAESGLDISKIHTFNNILITKVQIDNIFDKVIKTENIGDLNSLKGIHKDRIDIFVAGFLLFYKLISFLKIQKILISSASLREGIIINSINISGK